MYTVEKLSVTTRHADGSHVYDYTLTYSTWRALVQDLTLRERHFNGVFTGAGAHVFHGEKLLGNVRAFGTSELDGVRIRATSRRSFIAANADD